MKGRGQIKTSEYEVEPLLLLADPDEVRSKRL